MHNLSIRRRSIRRRSIAVRAAIENLEPRQLLATIVVTSTADTIAPDGVVTLREAIVSTNANSSINGDVVPAGAYGADTINFSIAGAAVHTIAPTSGLPDITDALTIDGYSQAGSSVNTLAVGDNAKLMIELSGASAPPANGLSVGVANFTLRGLIVNNWKSVTVNGVPTLGTGVNFGGPAGGGTILIEGNWIGVNSAGTAAAANYNGISMIANNATIGGTTPAARNIISGNTSQGILLSGNANVVEGNYVGTNAAGTGDVGNGNAGITLSENTATNSEIGGTTAAARNVFSGNDSYGIVVFRGASGNKIEGNYIGANAAGDAAIGNIFGIEVLSSSNNTIGGTAAGAGNLISGNTGAGIHMERVSPGDFGAGVDAASNLIQGNQIGTNAAGTGPIGNLVGIWMQGVTQNTIGGSAAGAGNVITASTNDGIRVDTGAFGFSTQDLIRGNSIYANGRLGINLFGGSVGGENPAGVTPDDPGDTDTGNNNLQNKPDIGLVQVANGHTLVSGSFLGSGGNGTLTLDVYASPDVDPSGFGEGKTYLGSVTVNDGPGTVTFNALQVSGAAVPNGYVSATLTDASNNTSEFSNGSVVVDDDPFLVSNTNDSGPHSLRQAILNANRIANVGGANDIIHFLIPGSGVKLISVLNVLPTITEAATIDGYTQPSATANTLAVGDNAKILIELSDANATRIPNAGGIGAHLPAGLEINASNCLIQGMSIHDDSISIVIDDGRTGNILSGNFIGIRPDGVTRGANNDFGLLVAGSTNRIGGLTPADRNVISGQANDGVVLQASGSGNVVEGNYVGTNAAGTAAIPSAYGVNVQTTSNNIIGGTTAAARNVISGNTFAGVILFHDAHDNFVQGNYIGTGADGTTAIPNGFSADNPNFSGHGGIWITDADHNIIGGAAPGAGNLIAFNKHDGIEVTQDPDDPLDDLPPPDLTVGNTFSRNSIFSNTALGIDLVGGTQDANGVTADDTNDADSGPNNLKNKFGSLGAIDASTALFAYNQDGQLFVGGSYLQELGSGKTETMEIFSNDAKDASGFGEGQTYLGSVTIIDGGGGVAVIPAQAIGAAIAAGKWISVTLTDLDGNTSEFSAAVQISPPPALAIANVTQDEGNTGTTTYTFTVTRTGDTQAVSIVDFTTADGTATVTDNDYAPTKGQLTFAAGDTSKTITVTVNGDTIVESNETFAVKLSNPSNATLATAQATGTITNDDSVTPPPARPSFKINDVNKSEGNSGTTTFMFTVTRTGDTTGVSSVAYTTVDGTAKAGSDYTAAASTLIFKAGETSKSISISVKGDTAVEADETFKLLLSSAVNATIADGSGVGTIRNDDAASPKVRITIGDERHLETDKGLRPVYVSVYLDKASNKTVTVKFKTQDSTAKAGSDYNYASGTVTFKPGETFKVITLFIRADTKKESDEQFFINLSSATNAVIADKQSKVTILNDD